MRILLVEPWLTGSHQAWAEGFAGRSAHEVHVVAHEGAYWRWRLRGGAVTLAERAAEVVAEHGPPDVVLASSMLDVPAFCGHARAWMGSTPTALYLHETQPARAALTGEPLDDDMAYRNWTSMVAADHVFVNSAFHRDALFRALPELLLGPPDQRHDHLLEAVRARTSLLPVGVDVGAVGGGRQVSDDGDPIVLWSHRWDHDKAPELFFRALRRLDHEGLAFRVALAGANARADPREFIEAEERFGSRLVHAGHLPQADYVELLGRSAIVVSTAVHEFFGVAMVEAMAAGAVPLLPRSLSYPEVVPDRFHAAVLYDAYGDMVRRLRSLLEDVPAARAAVDGLATTMDRFDWAALAPAYDAALEAVAAGKAPDDVPSPNRAPGVITDVDGIEVGHWTDAGARTGCTVVLVPEGTAAAAEVRGGAPASRELDLLVPGRLVDRIDAVLLTGGSAFGLAAADGVMTWLEERGRGFTTPAGPVPIVPALGLFDLAVGSASVRPGPVEGRAACDAATAGEIAHGAVGAGTGATVGKWLGPEHVGPGGLGGATVRSGPLVVSALVAVNAYGSIDPDGRGLDGVESILPSAPPAPMGNTTIGVIATNARIDEDGCLVVAQGGHDGLGRSIVPAHTRVDGDALVAVATGRVEALVDHVRLLAVAAVERAVRSLA